MKKDKYNFDDFKSIIKILLGENGCPWDKAQTHESLKKYLIEECYELIDAINNDDKENMCEELGDVLLQIMLHSQIEENADRFCIEDVIDSISRKMINRHTHIFSDDIANTEEDVKEYWNKAKKKEKGYNNFTDELKSVSKSLPALMRAEKVQKKAADVGLDFENINEAMIKVYEELEELKEAFNGTNLKKMEEFGDILFSVVNISRFLKLNPEFALTNSLEKFINRFEYIENALIKKGKTFDSVDINCIDALWNESKSQKNSGLKNF